MFIIYTLLNLSVFRKFLKKSRKHETEIKKRNLWNICTTIQYSIRKSNKKNSPLRFRTSETEVQTERTKSHHVTDWAKATSLSFSRSETYKSVHKLLLLLIPIVSTYFKLGYDLKLSHRQENYKMNVWVSVCFMALSDSYQKCQWYYKQSFVPNRFVEKKQFFHWEIERIKKKLWAIFGDSFSVLFCSVICFVICLDIVRRSRWTSEKFNLFRRYQCHLKKPQTRRSQNVPMLHQKICERLTVKCFIWKIWSKTISHYW